MSIYRKRKHMGLASWKCNPHYLSWEKLKGECWGILSPRPSADLPFEFE